MYNDYCKTDACCVPVTLDSMKNIVIEIHDHAMKERKMAFDIYKNLFGEIPNDKIYGNDNNEIECAFDVLVNINEIERDTLEALNAVIGRIG